MALRYRRRLHLGHLAINLSRSGVSTSLKAGDVTVNPQRRRAWLNLPGGFYWVQPLPRSRSK